MDIKQFNAVVGSTAEEFAASGVDPSQLFAWQITKQNAMYSLPINTDPTLDGLSESPLARISGFLKTLQKEIEEGKEIQALLGLRDRLVAAANTGDNDWSTLLQSYTIRDALVVHSVDEKRATKIEIELIAAIDHALALNNDLLDHTFTREDLIAQEFDRQLLVMLGDWLGDMTVYIRSEALKFGLPLEAILMCIMGSNFTKLGADGEVIKDENGKVQKGPNFQPPEAHIYATMFEREALMDEVQARTQELDALNTLAVPALINPTAEAVESFLADDEVDADEDELDNAIEDEV